jgi:hypothetical protein
VGQASSLGPAPSAAPTWSAPSATQGTLGRPVLYSGALDCLRTILRTEGPAGFYAASLPLYLKVVPSIGCSYALYELLLSHMSRPAAGESAGP